MTNQRVPVDVIAGLDALRSSGHCNMFDLSCVFYWLNAHQYLESVKWVRDHHEDYVNGIANGFAATP